MQGGAQSRLVKGRAQAEAGDIMIDVRVRAVLAVEEHTGLHHGQRVGVCQVGRQLGEVCCGHKFKRLAVRGRSGGRGPRLCCGRIDLLGQFVDGLVLEELLEREVQAALLRQRQ